MANGDPANVLADIVANIEDDQDRLDVNDVPRVDMKFGQFPALPENTIPDENSDQLAMEEAIRAEVFSPDIDSQATTYRSDDISVTEDDATVVINSWRDGSGIRSDQVGGRVWIYDANEDGVEVYAGRITAVDTEAGEFEVDPVVDFDGDNGLRLVVKSVEYAYIYEQDNDAQIGTVVVIGED